MITRVIAKREQATTIRFRRASAMERASVTAGLTAGSESDSHIFAALVAPVSFEEIRRAAGGSFKDGTHELYIRHGVPCQASGHTHAYGDSAGGVTLRLEQDDEVSSESISAVVIGVQAFPSTTRSGGYDRALLKAR